MFRRSISWIDWGSRERMTMLTSTAGAPDTYDAMVVLSNATPTTWHEGEWLSTGAATPPVAMYASSEVQMVLSVEDAVNHRSHVFIPAPQVSLLLADRINQDGTNFEWIDLEAELSTLSIPFSALPVVALLAATAVFRAAGAYETYSNYNGGITWGRRANQWRDTLGNSWLQFLAGPVGALTSPPTLAALTTKMEAVSTAIVTDYWEGEMTVFPSPVPTTDQYNSVRDYCKVVFADDFGNKTNVTIPAPNRAIFLEDGKTLNQIQPNVAIFIAAALSELSVPNSNRPVQECIGGLLVKTRSQGY